MNDRIQNLIDSFIEINLASEEAFLLCKETLTRIGIASNKDKKLYQSCHILHKKGKYYLVHFKELFALDNKANELDETDKPILMLLNSDKVREMALFSLTRALFFSRRYALLIRTLTMMESCSAIMIESDVTILQRSVTCSLAIAPLTK